MESMATVFLLVRKNGGIIALTLDESGIPETAEGRLAVVHRILSEAEKCGIAKKHIVFHLLALTISADKKLAKETRCAVDLINDENGCNTSLGVFTL